MTPQEMYQRFVSDLIAKSGVREWQEPESRAAIIATAIEFVDGFFGVDEMALPDFFKTYAGTPKTIKSSSGDATMAFASLANTNGTSTGAVQSSSFDFGEFWDCDWVIETDFEHAATPTAGTAVDVHCFYNSATGAGRGGTSGSSAAYTGYANNINACLVGNSFIHSHLATANATATVQKPPGSIFRPQNRYGNFVAVNRTGAALHSTETNQVIRLFPLIETIRDEV
jgi:hypothetical protein